jgi:hypothetical protein
MQNSKTILETVAHQLTKTEYERQIDAIRLFPDVLRVAQTLGSDKAECIQSANRAIAVITGVNVLELFKVKAPAPVTREKYLTLGMLGARLKTNWQTAQKRLRSIGFVYENGVTESGRAFYVEGKGWSEQVIELLQEVK